jgi:DNA-binding response OmpR family regulator
MACILLADADEPTRNFMAMKLREAGYEVDIAQNGHEAIILLSSRRHDLIISDLELLGKNGLEVLREIRRHPEYMTMPFVLFTRADPGHRTDNGHYGNLMQELDALGATYLPKTASNLRQFPAIRIVK